MSKYVFALGLLDEAQYKDYRQQGGKLPIVSVVVGLTDNFREFEIVDHHLGQLYEVTFPRPWDGLPIRMNNDPDGYFVVDENGPWVLFFHEDFPFPFDVENRS